MIIIASYRFDDLINDINKLNLTFKETEGSFNGVKHKCLLVDSNSVGIGIDLSIKHNQKSFIFVNDNGSYLIDHRGSISVSKGTKFDNNNYVIIDGVKTSYVF